MPNAKIEKIEFDKHGVMATLKIGNDIKKIGISYKAFKTKDEYLEKLKGVSLITPNNESPQNIKDEIIALEGSTVNPISVGQK